MSAGTSDFVAVQRRLLETEREAELDYVRALSVHSSYLSRLERAGAALTRLSLVSRAETVGGFVTVELASRGGRILSAPLLSQGDIVMILAHGQKCDGKSGNSSHSKSSKLHAAQAAQTEGVLGTVEEKRLEVVIGADASENFAAENDSNALYAVVKFGSDVTHKRYLKALSAFEKAVDDEQHPSQRILSVLYRGAEPKFDDRSSVSCQQRDKLMAELNDSQRGALQHALCATDVAVLHGPPGTGKTSTLVSYIAAEVARGARVLATAPSNIAVDNIAEKLVATQKTVPFKFVRIGHPARVMPAVMEHTLEARLAQSDEAGLARDCRAELAELHLKEMKAKKIAERRIIRAEKRELRKELRKRENDALHRLLKRVDVVLTTLAGAGARSLDIATSSASFDVVCVDEAGQAQEAACIVALLRGKKAVFAGDPSQLPPTVKSIVAAAGGLGRTVLDRIFCSKDLTSRCVHMLTIQYRMHGVISKWSSDAFYNGKLCPASSVRDHLLKDLHYVVGHRDLPESDYPDMFQPWVLIDTAGCDCQESSEDDAVSADSGPLMSKQTKESEQAVLQFSRYNEGEARIVVSHAQKLLDSGVRMCDIGVISPYAGQVTLLRNKFREVDAGDIEVVTVDSFQGREKEAIILSMVRSNDCREIGFLTDIRRLNVAITRARRHVCIVCDSATLSQHPFLSEMIDYATEHGDYRCAEG